MSRYDAFLGYLLPPVTSSSNRPIPYGGNIQRIDSRAWDPNWEYRNAYRALVNSLYTGLGIFPESNFTKAINLASQESYFWGRA